MNDEVWIRTKTSITSFCCIAQALFLSHYIIFALVGETTTFASNDEQTFLANGDGKTLASKPKILIDCL